MSIIVKTAAGATGIPARQTAEDGQECPSYAALQLSQDGAPERSARNGASVEGSLNDRKWLSFRLVLAAFFLFAAAAKFYAIRSGVSPNPQLDLLLSQVELLLGLWLLAGWWPRWLWSRASFSLAVSPSPASPASSKAGQAVGVLAPWR